MDATLEAIITARLNLALREGCLLEAKLELINELILRKILLLMAAQVSFQQYSRYSGFFTGNPKNLF